MPLKPVTTRLAGFDEKTYKLYKLYKLYRDGRGLLDAPRPLFYFGHEERACRGWIDYENRISSHDKKAPSTGKKEKELNEWIETQLPRW